MATVTPGQHHPPPEGWPEGFCLMCKGTGRQWVEFTRGDGAFIGATCRACNGSRWVDWPDLGPERLAQVQQHIRQDLAFRTSSYAEFCAACAARGFPPLSESYAINLRAQARGEEVEEW